MLFFVFIIVSCIFWLILALNDSAQNYFNVTVRITNQPDTVTFISEVPDKIHVLVSDKGTTLWRNGYLKNPMINIDFKEYSADGVLRYSYNDLLASLREAFGSNATFSSVSLDSLLLYYTTNPGKLVPIVVKCEVTPAVGSILEGHITSDPPRVKVYGSKETLDTINFITTEKLTLTDLNETAAMSVKLHKLKNARAIPDRVVLNIPIEPLVMKHSMITVDTENVPEGDDLLLFPSKVPVEYYVAMSRLNDDEDPNIKLVVNYDNIANSASGKLPVEVRNFPERLRNLKLRTDSVEYAIVKE